MPTVSIVIVNYNTREPLRRCLQSIHVERGDIDVEVIVVDNNSNDDSATMVREVMPEAHLIEPGRNTWFSGGNNLGFQQVQGDFIYILNADTRLQPGSLQTMLAHLQSHPEVGVVTCRMEYPEGGLQRTCSRVPAYVDLLLGYTFLGVLLQGCANAAAPTCGTAVGSATLTEKSRSAPVRTCCAAGQSSSALMALTNGSSYISPKTTYASGF
ncbi:MAG: glycosyltransferase [Anaerolineae bacterium]